MSFIKPKVNDLVINPKTNKPVKVGGRVWLKLVKEGIIANYYEDDNELYDVNNGDDVNEIIDEINKELPINQHAVRGRGKYADKIVKRHKQPNTKDITKHTAKITANKLKNRDLYEDLIDGDNFEEDLEKLILEEMMEIKPKPTKPIKISRTKADSNFYVINNLDDDSESETESEYSESEYSE